MKLETKLRSLSARSAGESYTGTEGDLRIYGLVEEVRDAVREYQVSGDPCKAALPVGRSTEVSIDYVSQQKNVYEQNLSIVSLCTSPFTDVQRLNRRVPLGFRSDLPALG